jgi:hypothetical protein
MVLHNKQHQKFFFNVGGFISVLGNNYNVLVSGKILKTNLLEDEEINDF